MANRCMGPAFIGLILALAFWHPPFASCAGYDINPFTAVFELVPDGNGGLNDVRVQMDITYDIRWGPKSTGFKNIGPLPVRNISVTDEQGRPLTFDKEKFKDAKITWSFPETLEGTRRIIVTFTLAGAVQTSDHESRVTLDWISDWKVPVHDATLVFLLPQGHDIQTIAAFPAAGELTDETGVPAYTVHLDRMSGQPFSIAFSPPAPHHPPSVFSRMFSIIAFILEKIMVIVITILGLAVLVGAFFLLLWMYQRFGPKGGGGGGPVDGGGCGGCGGGGGGGCGGGGCGG